MKPLAVLLFAVLFISVLPAQDKNYCSIDSTTGDPMLLGYCNRDAFKDTSFSWWFNSEYLLYNVDSVSAEKIKEDINDVELTIVMGSWCSDSRRWVPEFFKIMDFIKYPSDSITIICVDRDMHGRKDETGGLNIKKVPTFIFFKNNKELGRIIEEPKVSIEKDILKILNG